MSQYIIYARKSTESEDRQILSIEAQIKELTDYTAKNGLSVAKTYIEAKSAKQPGRPVFNEMVKDLRRKKATGILCWKLDRLTRNLLDAALISELLESGIISEIRTPSQIYRNTSNDKFMTGLDFIMAKKYIDDLSENVRRGIKARVERGWAPARPPVGYLNYRNPETGQSSIIVDKSRFPLVRRIWDLMLSGNYSVARILKIANEDWGFRTRRTKRTGEKPLSRGGLYRMFLDRFYCGQIVFKGELLQGKHQPLITVDEFDEVQRLLGRIGKGRLKKHEFAFTGIIRCGGCGGMVTAEEKYKFIKATQLWKRYAYYRCGRRKKPACRQPPISEDSLKQQIEALLSQIEMPREYLNWIFKYLDKVVQTESEKKKAQDNLAGREICNIERRLQNLLSLKISPDNADGRLLSDAEYLNQKNKLMKIKAQLEGKLVESRDLEQKVIALTRETFKFATYARIWFAKGTPDRQQEILSSVGLNHTLTDRKLLIQPRKPLSLIEKRSFLPLPKSDRFEPREFGKDKEKDRAFGPAFLINSGLVNKVRTEIKKMLQKAINGDNDLEFNGPF